MSSDDGAARPSRIVARFVAWIALAGVLAMVAPTWWAQVRPAPGFAVEPERVDAALAALPDLLVVPEPKDLDDYDRTHFGPAWFDLDGNGCDTRNDMLTHWLREVTFDPVQPCLVVTGILDDPYTGRQIEFRRGPQTSADVQIDHVVALADAWRKGAEDWPSHVALAFANDPANLIAADGGANQDKGADDAASWLPPHPGFRCAYATQQVLVKAAYAVGVSSDELGALTEQLELCPALSSPVRTRAGPADLTFTLHPPPGRTALMTRSMRHRLAPGRRDSFRLVRDHESDRGGHLRVADGNELYFEAVGNPDGPAVLWLHGGPGSGAKSGHAQRIDPARQQSVTFDQRGCGRSRPLVTERLDLLDTNTTTAQIDDIETLRRHLGIERWTVTGASWGSTLSLAYAQAHPERVTGIALVAVTNTSTEEVEWITETMGRFFPAEWERFAGAVPQRPGERVVDAYARALRDADPEIRAAAARSWGRWEDTHVSLGPGWTPDPRWQDPDLSEVIATLVTHYWSHSGFGGDQIARRMDRIAHIPAVLIHGRRDISGPPVIAYRLHQAWPASRLVILDEGHGGPESMSELRRAISELAQ